MIFDKESKFEDAIIETLKEKGWDGEILEYPTENDLLKNWAKILYENNKHIDRLNDTPLTDTEMGQIIEQIKNLRTPIKLNGFINGKTITIKRDNPDDKLHYGKEVSLKIYDRQEIAGGSSRYQIARQPIFKAKDPILRDRRGDFMLLINGMPVIHVELKKSGIPVSQAYNQIEKYSKEGVFTGIYSLVQIFVAMTPDECVYFANPGPDGRFNKDFYFHWADFNNEPINDWLSISSTLLHIPMAHEMIGYYTVADTSDGILKIMRSYQYYAANKIADRVDKLNKSGWTKNRQLGGYVWHTTGSGKTMTSFKSAQLIANSKKADKVVFLMDRVELGTQSLYEYRAFSDDTDDVQATENTRILISKLKSTDPANTLIVTSIQKMSRINEDEGGFNASDIEIISNKKIVFIVDEAHRSTFGDMLVTVKNTFSNAIFFGFTGTPIYDKNKKKDSTTSTIFGSELHRYTIADGIRDGNVLGFDTYKCCTYKDRDLRKAVALEKSGAKDEQEVFSNDVMKKTYMKYMNDVPMVGFEDDKGKYQKGIEDYIKNIQYDRDEHRNMVVDDIFDNWTTLSSNGKFHAIFATSSIPEAIKYYRIMKEKRSNLKITALFDSNIDNNGNGDGEGSLFKEDGLVEIIKDYNATYGMNYDLSTHDKFKKDISSRLSHKKPYERIEKDKDKQLDILIVVDQMLTGFDSKWVNVLYLDKILKYENIIQAFSRTNRLFGPDKPFGVIRYYRKPNTMERNIAEAVKYYSGDRELDLFVEQLPHNLKKMNETMDEIKYIFDRAGIKNLEKLPEDSSERGEFAKLFKEFNNYYEAAKVQGFTWDEKEYTFEKYSSKENKLGEDGFIESKLGEDGFIENKLDGDDFKEYEFEEKDFNQNKLIDDESRTIRFEVEKDTYLTLVNRYKELAKEVEIIDPEKPLPYDIDCYLVEIDTGKIDNDYMNSRFDKYLRNLKQKNISEEELQETLNELHKSFSRLSQEDQRHARRFLHDVESGSITLIEGKSFIDYITDYKIDYNDRQVEYIHSAIGVDKNLLKEMLSLQINEKNINEYGRLDNIERTIDKVASKAFFDKKNGKSSPPFKYTIMSKAMLKDFILNKGLSKEDLEEFEYKTGKETYLNGKSNSDFVISDSEKE